MASRLGPLHLAAGALAVILFLVTGQLMSFHEPPVVALPWDERLLFRSRHIYVLCAGLVNLAIGVRYALPAAGGRRRAALLGSLLLLGAVGLLSAAFFAEPMAGAGPGPVSSLGLFALLGGVLLVVLANLRRARED